SSPCPEIFATTDPSSTYASTKPACRCGAPTRPGGYSTWLTVTSQSSIVRFGRSCLNTGRGAGGGAGCVCASACPADAMSSANSANDPRTSRRVIMAGHHTEVAGTALVECQRPGCRARRSIAPYGCRHVHNDGGRNRQRRPVRPALGESWQSAYGIRVKSTYLAGCAVRCG